MFKPRDLMGHASLGLGDSSSGVAASRDGIPIRPIASFQRTRDPKTREAHEVPLLPPPSASVGLALYIMESSFDRTDLIEYLIPFQTSMGRATGPTMSELIADHRFFTQPSSSSAPNGNSTSQGLPGSVTDGRASSARVAELEAELTKVRSELSRAKGLNNALWESTVTAVLSSSGAGSGKKDKEGGVGGSGSGASSDFDIGERAKKRGRQE